MKEIRALLRRIEIDAGNWVQKFASGAILRCVLDQPPAIYPEGSLALVLGIGIAVA